MVHLKRSLFAVVLLLSPAAMLTLASDFVPIQNFREPADSPFPEFGFDGSLVVEDFETGRAAQPGIELSITNGSSSITRGFSIVTDSDDSEGLALQVAPTICAQSFPPSCPATVDVSFDLDVLDSYPTFVGFVWTDAVASAEALRAPIALVTVTDANGEETVRRINEIPFASELSDAQADDTFISFLDEDGISDMVITVITDGTGLGGGLAIDHIQYGFAARSGDADVDGDVDFSDFINLSSNFGMTNVGWAEGDFDHNGETDFLDFLRLSRNFGQASEPVLSNVPEPSSYALLILSSMSLLGLRKRL